MKRNDVMAEIEGFWPESAVSSVAAQKHASSSGISDLQSTHPVFATRAQAQLLDVLGWEIVASPRRDVEHHAPLQCCFVLRDGRREEAAFGYTGLTAPRDLNAPALRMAQMRAERFLASLGEDRGVLLQNTPLFSFGGWRQDRVVVFGGWRFLSGVWKPFLLGPDGLPGVVAQDVLFAWDTAPYHMAEIYGHFARAVMPWIAGVVQAIGAPCGHDATEDRAGAPGLNFDGLQIVPSFPGWFRVRACQPSEITPARRDIGDTRQCGSGGVAAAREFWDSGADEFQFHRLGMDRR